MGYHAEKAHKQLCRDIFGKHEPGYIFSDSYDLVQSVALFLCGHYGEYLDDVLYISKRGKPRTIKIECYLIITRMLARDHRALCKCQCLEFTKEEPEPVGCYRFCPISFPNLGKRKTSQIKQKPYIVFDLLNLIQYMASVARVAGFEPTNDGVRGRRFYSYFA